MKAEMSEELWVHLNTLARLLLDARTAAGAVRRQAAINEYNTGRYGDGAQAMQAADAAAAEYDLTLDIGVLRERVRILMARAEEK